MTTQEQLKIYAAYLPHRLELQVYWDDPEHSRIVTMVAIDTDEIYTYSRGPESWYISGRDEKHNMRGNYGIRECKPILYDLSFLTKEHEEKALTLSNILNKDYEWLIRNPELYKELSVFEYEIFLKYHFNVFGIPAGEFIEKSTLKTESND